MKAIDEMINAMHIVSKNCLVVVLMRNTTIRFICTHLHTSDSGLFAHIVRSGRLAFHPGLPRGRLAAGRRHQANTFEFPKLTNIIRQILLISTFPNSPTLHKSYLNPKRRMIRLFIDAVAAQGVEETLDDNRKRGSNRKVKIPLQFCKMRKQAN